MHFRNPKPLEEVGVVSPALFRVTEYEQVTADPRVMCGPEGTKLRFYYQSTPMCLRDASRFAAALSYARGTYVSATPAEGERGTYREWWFAGALWVAAQVPPLLVCTEKAATEV
jgi:hypothetical protein